MSNNRQNPAFYFSGIIVVYIRQEEYETMAFLSRPYIIFFGIILSTVLFLSSENVSNNHANIYVWLVPFTCIIFWSDLIFHKVKKQRQAFMADVLATVISSIVFLCFIAPLLFASVIK